MAEKNYRFRCVPDISVAAWELLFRLVTEDDSLALPDPNVSIDTYGAARGEMAQRRIFGNELIAVGLAKEEDGELFATRAAEAVIAAFEDAWEAVHS